MSVSVIGEVDAVAVDPVGRAFSNKKNPGKVPRKIHKAEREKLKCDHINELFVELGNALASLISGLANHLHMDGRVDH
ncbi:Transcription factor bHLH47 [Acorus calamus]|uniref:Transcription factor bHLH47 n=1 Tax=Acorus calamus TaxID=4465 RepID=A0AAV9E987_ACOCL|nr:Transcription factor bHLH47 [Acorus calamus]